MSKSKAISKPGNPRATTSTPRSVPPSAPNAQHVAYQSSKFEGPLPPPGMLAEYNTAIPGLGEAIMKEFLDQTAHVRAAEMRAFDAHDAQVQAQIRIATANQKVEALLRFAGLAAALIVVLTWIGATIALAVLKQTEASIASLGFGMVGIVGLFITGKYAQHADAKIKKLPS